MPTRENAINPVETAIYRVSTVMTIKPTMHFGEDLPIRVIKTQTSVSLLPLLKILIINSVKNVSNMVEIGFKPVST